MPRRRLERLALEKGGNALADADAHGGDPIPPASAFQLAEQRARKPRTRGADRVTDGDRAAVRVGAVVGQGQLADAWDDLRRERLIQLDRVAFLRRHAGALHELADGGDRTEAHKVGMHAGRCARHHPAERTQPQRTSLLTRADEQSGGAVVDAGRVPRGHRAVLAECGLQLAKLLERALRPRMLVLGNELRPVVNGLDLPGEEPGGLRLRVVVLTSRGITVLLRATDVLLFRDVLSGLAERDGVITEVDHARVDEPPSERR